MREGQVSQCPGHDVSGVEYLHQGEGVQEEVHGRVQGGAVLCEDGDQTFTQQGHQVDQQHPLEPGPLQGPEVGESQKEEFRQSLIFFSQKFRLEPMTQPTTRC